MNGSSLNSSELTDYIHYSMVEQNNHIRINGDYPIVNKVLGLISRQNPITGLFQLSLLSDTERGLVVDLSQGKSITKISFF